MAAEGNRLFERMFEDSSDPAFLMDPINDRIVEANRAGCALLGYTREELLRATVSDIHPAEMPQLRAFLGLALRDGRATTTKFTCRTKSGTFLPTEISLHVVDSEVADTSSGWCRTAASTAGPSPNTDPSQAAPASTPGTKSVDRSHTVADATLDGTDTVDCKEHKHGH